MAQQNPSITNIVHRIATRLEREVNDRLPRRVGVIAVKHFNQNFRDSGFRNNGLRPWPETRRQREGKGADRRRKPLISAAPHLSRSNQAIPMRGAVRITNPVPYARIHNEGGKFTTHPTVTPKMRKMAWARVYAIAGARKGKKLPKELPAEAQKWKALALTKKNKLSIRVNMPRRQFIGNSAELKQQIDKIIIDTLNRIKQQAIR